jgi:hypothetical protein
MQAFDLRRRKEGEIHSKSPLSHLSSRAKERCAFEV